MKPIKTTADLPRQQAKVIEHLMTEGSLTRFEAAFDLGIMELSSRIGELERHGFIIPREWQKGRAKDGTAYQVRKYLTPTGFPKDWQGPRGNVYRFKRQLALAV
jgi:hypothetical protein